MVSISFHYAGLALLHYSILSQMKLHFVLGKKVAGNCKENGYA